MSVAPDGWATTGRLAPHHRYSSSFGGSTATRGTGAALVLAVNVLLARALGVRSLDAA